MSDPLYRLVDRQALGLDPRDGVSVVYSPRLNGWCVMHGAALVEHFALHADALGAARRLADLGHQQREGL